ncbi:hypothetical protein VNO77_26207 [Canavalia gladiata]|uniref:Uncharacterized protein n=1 Tax=Canavalia gladiata TaxID=3824 RepID=A0AAN9KTU9_CANGL
MDGAKSARPIPGRRGKDQASMSRRARRSLQNPRREPGRKRSSVQILVVVANIQMRTLKAEEGKGSILPTLETAQPEVGSSGWKSTARRVVSGAPPAALENPEDRVPPRPGRTHNRIRIGSEGWARGSQSRTRRLSVDCSSCSRGESGSPRAGRGTDWERALRGLFPGRRTVDSELRNHSQGNGLCGISGGKEDPVELGL